MISWIFMHLWKRKPLGRVMYPIWIVNGGKWCTKGIWCVISRISILVLKITIGTETLGINVSKLGRGKKAVFRRTMWRRSKKSTFLATTKPFISPRHYANIDIMLSENNSMITESESVAKIFNKYFKEIAEGIGFNDPIPENFAKDILLSMIKRYDDHHSIMAMKSFCTQGQSFDFIHVTPNDIKSCIVNLDGKKSTGYDGIPVKLLKVGTEPLSVTISKLINFSIDECTFPDLLKYAEMAALFKKLDRLCKENYRPVSILTALSKVFEKIYCRQLTSYFSYIFQISFRL